MVCELACPQDIRRTQNALLDYLVHHAAKLVPVSFSKVLTLENDSSFVCRAAFTGYPVEMNGFSSEEVPEAAWHIYREALNQDKPLVLYQNDLTLNWAERKALGLEHACRLWLLPIRANQASLGLLVLGEGSNFLRTGYVMRGMQMLLEIVDRVALTLQQAQWSENREESIRQIVFDLAVAYNLDGHHPEHRSCPMADLTMSIAHEFGFSNGEMQTIHWAGLLHDIGKIKISPNVLLKPGPLTTDEWDMIKKHPAYGAEILSPVASLARVADIVLAHHERWDGKGYPFGLRSNEIPLGARILAVADAFSVMVNGRVYRAPLSPSEALAEVVRCSGTHFDPMVVNVLMQLVDEGELDIPPKRPLRQSPSS